MKNIPLLLALLTSISLFAQGKRILVLSGGAARGAWGGGLAQTLVEDLDYDYQCVIGSSTGSLLAPLIALGEFELLKEGYTTISDKDIFNVRPFKNKGKKCGEIKGMQSFMRLLIGKRTLGESKNLRKTIPRFYPEELFQRFETNGKEHIATVVNLTTDKTEYKSSKDETYEEMLDWMWASANVPIFMSLVKKEVEVDGKKVKHFYVDGGIKEGIPLQKGLQKACELGIKNIDVIVHNTIDPKLDPMSKGGVFKLLSRTTELFLSENRQNDLVAARRTESIVEVLEADCTVNEEVMHLNYFFMPKSDHELIAKDLMFNQEEMRKLWERGRKHVNEKLMNEELKPLLIQVEIPLNQVCMQTELLGNQ